MHADARRTRRCRLARADPTTRAYRLGPALVELGAAAEVASSAGREADELISLSARTGFTCIVWERSDDDLVLAEIVGPDGPEHTWAGLGRGHRFRPLAPLGASVVAWADDERVDAWFAASGPEPAGADGVAPGVRERASAALDASRRRGYVVELMDEMQHEVFRLVQQLRSSGPTPGGDLLTSIAHRASRELLEGQYLVGDIDDAATYRPVSVNAPVFDRWRAAQLVVCLVGGSTDVDGNELRRLGELVRDTAVDLTRAAGGALPPSWPT
ncbi:MAG: hypothetical protein S0880_16615 [Actinomycetota bacterium]|nr:hypothetical protein [Actinomycetota bacterium]